MNRLINAVLALGLVAGFSAFAGDSELDGKAKKDAPVIIKHLDVEAQTLTTYEVKSLPPEMKAEALDKLSKEERNKAIEAYLKKVAVKENQTAQTKVVKAKVADSELDGDKGTAACGWRWRGYYGGYYGGGFYGGYYGGGYAYYNPYWNYGYGYGGYAGYGYAYGGCGYSVGYSNYAVYTAW